MALAELGIDPRVATLLEASGIQDLYPPQAEAWQAIRTGANCLVAIPTASGKSLVAYLAILHRWLATGKKALYIVPLRALASEKHEELGQFRPLGLTVGIATGDLDEKDPRLGRFDVVVCTSEKADALLRHRSQGSWIDDIGCIVADEAHLLNDPGRGPTLEVILTRFRSILPQAQIVALSATIQNAKDVARWLDARLVTSDWRPTKLHVGTYLPDRLEFLGGKPRLLESAGDPVAALVEDTIRSGGQCLVFVSTRKSAEAQAQKLAGPVRALLSEEQAATLKAAAEGLESDEASPTGRKLRKFAEAGVGFHTAGLDGKQRRWLEDSFRKGLVKVLCATPTLAAGVNTPARRVVIRDLTRFDANEGNRPLPVMEVKQMMGRAGRPRYDPFGEAVLLVKSAEQKEAAEETYLRGDVEPVASKLAAEGSLRMHVLATIAGGYADSRDALHAFFAKTFWAAEVSDWIVRDRLDDVLAFLEENGFVSDKARLAATPFGRRTSDLYIDPLSALRFKEAFASPLEGTQFALLEVVAGCPDVFALYLRREDDWVQQRFWEHHEELLVASDGKDLEAALSYAKTAFLLQDWMQETSLEAIEERYAIGPGDLRARLDSCNWMLHAFGELAREGRPAWAKPIQELALRLEHGIKAELLPLIQLRGIGRHRARTLHAAGFPTPASLRAAPASRLAELPGFGPKLVADVLNQVGGDPAQKEPDLKAAPPGKGKGQTTVFGFGHR